MNLVTINNIEKRLANWHGCYYLDPDVDLEQWAAQRGLEIVSVEDREYVDNPAEPIARDAWMVLGKQERLAASWSRYLEEVSNGKV